MQYKEMFIKRLADFKSQQTNGESHLQILSTNCTKRPRQTSTTDNKNDICTVDTAAHMIWRNTIRYHMNITSHCFWFRILVNTT